MSFNFLTIWDTTRKILDIIILWALIYTVLKNIKNNVKLSLLIKGILFIIILNWLSNWLGLVKVGYLLQYIIQWGPIALIIIFQPEIRTILEQIGKTQLLGRHKILTVDEREKLVYSIIMAVDQMRKARIGALIVIERDISLMDYINKSTNLYAEITSELLVSLFFPNNPLHDGGVIIQGDKISCAGAVFPTSNSLKINKRLGTRHRAALGITEETDAIAIIVSEETGRISIAIKGELFYNLSIDDARILLLDELRPKHEDFEEEFDKEEEV
jgi:diadenylate cyclase